MRHRRREKHFGRKPSARTALFRGLIVSLVEHGRIKTTVDKAKELRRHVEKAITIGKAGDLAARRLLLSRVANETTVENLISNVSKRFKDRPGGYTRIIKIGRRPGDAAEMAFIEFVDYDFKAKEKLLSATKAKKEAAAKADTKEEKAAKKELLKEKAAAAKKASRARATAKRSRAKMQKASRVEARG